MDEGRRSLGVAGMDWTEGSGCMGLNEWRKVDRGRGHGVKWMRGKVMDGVRLQLSGREVSE